MKVMAYGHAERALAAIRILEAETADLLVSLDHPDAEQAQWLHDISLRGDLPLPDFPGPGLPSPVARGTATR
jgi:hypothetical protein